MSNNGSLLYVQSQVTLDAKNQGQYFDYDLTQPLNAHNINICCDLNNIIGYDTISGSVAPGMLKLPYRRDDILVSGNKTDLYVDVWDPSGNNSDMHARDQLRRQLFDHSQVYNSGAAPNTGAAVRIKLRTSAQTSSPGFRVTYPGMEGFYKTKADMIAIDQAISNFESEVSGAAYAGVGVNWTTSGSNHKFTQVTGSSVLGMMTQKFVPSSVDTPSATIGEGVTIATRELMNDYLTSDKVLNTISGNVEDEFGLDKRLDNQDTVLGQLEEAVISLFDAIGFKPEHSAAKISTPSEELFLRSWMDRDTTNQATKKFQIEPDKIKRLLCADASGYNVDAVSGNVSFDLIKCVFDQDQMKHLAQLIEQQGRYKEVFNSTNVYTSPTDETQKIGVADGIEQEEYNTIKSRVPFFRHGQGIAVLVPVQATVPTGPLTTADKIENGVFLVRVFQSYWHKNSIGVSALTEPIRST
jgi:hypothetical protein